MEISSCSNCSEYHYSACTLYAFYPKVLHYCSSHTPAYGTTTLPEAFLLGAFANERWLLTSKQISEWETVGEVVEILNFLEIFDSWASILTGDL